MGVLVDGGAVRAVSHGDEVGWALAGEELAHVAAAAEAHVASAALGSAAEDDAIAHAHAADFGADGFDDTDAAVALDERHFVDARAGGTRGVCGRGWLEAEHGAGVRVAEAGGFGADLHLAAGDGAEGEGFELGALGAVALGNPGTEAAGGDGGGGAIGLLGLGGDAGQGSRGEQAATGGAFHET